MQIRAAAGGLKARLDQPVLGVVGHALIQPIAQDLATARQNRRHTAKHAIHAHAQIQRNERLRALQRPDPDLVVVHGALPAQFANSCAERGETGTADVGLQTRGIADLSGGNAEARQWTLQHGQVALAQQIDVHGEVAQPLDTPPLQRERRIGMGAHLRGAEHHRAGFADKVQGALCQKGDQLLAVHTDIALERNCVCARFRQQSAALINQLAAR